MNLEQVPTVVIASLVLVVWMSVQRQLAEAKPSSSSSCKYWCKDEEARYYCCPSGRKPTSIWSLADLLRAPSKLLWPHLSGLWSLLDQHSLPIAEWLWLDERHLETHEEAPYQQRCPDLRPACPRGWPSPPEACDSDDECAPGEMCCFDVCLNHKTCKPSLPDDVS